MKRILLNLIISFMVLTGLAVAEGTAQQTPPSIDLGLAFSGSLLPDRLLYRMGDRLQVVLTLHNSGAQEITSKGFSALPFHLFLTFVDPDGKGIIADELMTETADDAPPPPVIPIVVGNEDQLPQVDPVEILPGNWLLSTTLPNAHAYYTLLKPGNYSVKAIIPIRTYLSIDHTVEAVDYSEITRQKWDKPLESNIVHFTLIADADGDGYYSPEDYRQGFAPDCNDSNAAINPGTVWYKDFDGDGYGDAHASSFTGCTPPADYYKYQLTATNTDCNDNNFNVNPGKGETPCNGIDDDCNPATPDFPAPTLASPANGATNVSTTPTLSWQAVSCATSYRLQVSTSQSNWTGSNLKINQSGISGTSYTIPSGKLSNNTTYYWRVNATNAGGTSGWSDIWSFTTIKKTYLLTVKKAGTGFGTVTASPPDNFTWDGSAGTGTYEAGTKVTLTATANAGSTFSGWSAYCSGSGNCSVVISGNKCTVNMCGPCNATVTFRKK